DVLKLSRGQRVPADVVILKCLSSEAGHNPTPAITEQPTNVEPLLVDAVGEGSTDSGSKGNSGAELEAQETNDAGPGGETFIRTDQLDGETDWKLRLASPLTQNLPTEELVRLRVTGSKPDRKVNEFMGTLELLSSRQDAMGNDTDLQTHDDLSKSVPLSI